MQSPDALLEENLSTLLVHPVLPVALEELAKQTLRQVLPIVLLQPEHELASHSRVLLQKLPSQMVLHALLDIPERVALLSAQSKTYLSFSYQEIPPFITLTKEFTGYLLSPIQPESVEVLCRLIRLSSRQGSTFLGPLAIQVIKAMIAQAKAAPSPEFLPVLEILSISDHTPLEFIYLRFRLARALRLVKKG